MQSEWLRRYFTEAHEHSHHDVASDNVLHDGEVSRRSFVKSGMATGMVASMVAGGLIGSNNEAEAAAESVMGKWWPSEWGPDDEVGASNRITPAKVLEAASLIQKGHVYPLGMTLESGVPTSGARHVSITIPGSPTGGPFGEHELMYNDEMFTGEIGQVGSQFDGLGHVGAKVGNEIRYYNGFTQEQVGGAYGLKKLGVHNVKPFFTRGILLDVLALKGGDRLPLGYVITMDDVIQTMRRQKINEPREGDVVMFRTGHIKLWMKDNTEYQKGCPGPGATVMKWLAGRKIACVGGDSWAVEAVPGENPNRPFESHVILMTMHGIHIIENQYLQDLAKDQIYEFAWSFNPLPIKGGTGSPGNSVAIT